MGYSLKIGPLMVLASLLGHHAYALPCPPGPTNCGPPPGAILDLAGTAIPALNTFQQYMASFTAANTITSISFAFRDDSAFLGLDDVSVTTGVGPNLLQNPGFESGPLLSQAPTGWTYLNTFGASSGGEVSGDPAPGPHTANNYYRDGATQAYDGISQAIPTTPGDLYTITFWLNDNNIDVSTFSDLSTNGNGGAGGNGVDLLVYAGAIPTLATPEPASLALLGAGIAGLGLLRRRKAGYIT